MGYGLGVERAGEGGDFVGLFEWCGGGGGGHFCVGEKV